MDSGIYKITSIRFPNKVYVGSAIDLKQRKNQHFNLLRKGCHFNIKLQRHYNKYGKDDLIYSIIEYAYLNLLATREQLFIDTINPSFNLCRIAYSTKGLPQSKATRKKRSQALLKRSAEKGQWHSDEGRKRISEAQKKRIYPINGKGPVSPGIAFIRKTIKKVELPKEPKDHKPRIGPSGFPGVTWEKAKQRWHGKFKLDKKWISAGRHYSPERAYRSLVDKKQKLGIAA